MLAHSGEKELRAVAGNLGSLIPALAPGSSQGEDHET